MVEQNVSPGHDAHIHDTHMDMSDSHGSHGSHDSMNHMNHDTMKMYFHTDLGIDYVFFKAWKPTTAAEMIGSCIFICVLAICYEGLKYYREYLLNCWRLTNYYVSSDVSNGNTAPNIISNGNILGTRDDNKVEIRRRMITFSHLIQTLLHMIQFFISYLLMLVFMTYNVYLCISVLIGAGLGYFLFGWYKTTAVDITEHCH